MSVVHWIIALPMLFPALLGITGGTFSPLTAPTIALAVAQVH